MKLFLQKFLLFLPWFINLANAIPAFAKVTLPNYEFVISKTENVEEVHLVKIDV